MDKFEERVNIVLQYFIVLLLVIGTPRKIILFTFIEGTTYDTLSINVPERTTKSLFLTIVCTTNNFVSLINGKRREIRPSIDNYP